MELFDKDTLKNRYFNQYTNYLTESLASDGSTFIKSKNLFNLYNKYTKYILKEDLNEPEKNNLNNIKNASLEELSTIIPLAVAKELKDYLIARDASLK